MDESRRCFLAEWYRADLIEPASDHVVARLAPGTELRAADGSDVTVVVSLAVPTDGVIFCVFAAASRDAVSEVCAGAGIPVQRVSDAFVGSPIVA